VNIPFETQAATRHVQVDAQFPLTLTLPMNLPHEPVGTRSTASLASRRRKMGTRWNASLPGSGDSEHGLSARGILSPKKRERAATIPGHSPVGGPCPTRQNAFPLLRAEHYPQPGSQSSPIPSGLQLSAQGWTAGGKGGRSYPGKSAHCPTTLKELHQFGLTWAPAGGRIAATPSELMHVAIASPRVAPSSQPWAEGSNPFGIRRHRPEDLGNAQPWGERQGEGGRERSTA
jgi:hypothetical protein